MSGEAFTSYVTNHILQPLEIPRGSWLCRHQSGPPRDRISREVLVHQSREGFPDRSRNWSATTAGAGSRSAAIISTVRRSAASSAAARAFGVFLQDQLRPYSALFNDATRALFCEPQQTTGGHPIAMTLGWHIGNLDGQRFFYKEGGGGGFHCMMRLYPTRGIGSVVMSNATSFDVANLLNTVDRALLIR